MTWGHGIVVAVAGKTPESQLSKSGLEIAFGGVSVSIVRVPSTGRSPVSPIFRGGPWIDFDVNAFEAVV